MSNKPVLLCTLLLSSCIAGDDVAMDGDPSTTSQIASEVVARTTAGGVALPTGWGLKVSDTFGTASGRTVTSFTTLHSKYYEGQYYNRQSNGLVKIPNVVINGEQQTYVHFEQAIGFASDHITIQARGHSDGSITSGELVSKRSSRNFCVEARYRTPNVSSAWPAFWFYGDANGHDASEIDVEQPIITDPAHGLLSVHDVTMYNHPTQGTLTINDPSFKSRWMTYSNSGFNASSAPHRYTTCYDDGQALLKRYLDGHLIYASKWRWNASLGGTGHGPDASVIFNLAVGGGWPGNTPSPKTFRADFELYSVEYYGPLS